MMGPMLLLQYVALTAPVFVPAVADAPQPMDRWKPTYADRAPARPRTVEYRQGHIVPPFVPDVTIPPLTWVPTYPDRIVRPALITSAQRTLTEPPFQPPLIYEGSYIIATGSLRPLLQYQAVTGPFQETPAPAPAVGAALVANPERVWPRRGTHPSRQQAFAMDATYTAPAAATVPALQFPTLAQPRVRVYPRAIYTWAQPHFGFTVAAPVLSWTGRYPDFPVRRAVRPQPEPRPFPLDYDTVINPPAVALSWSPRYPARVPARPRRQAALEPVAIGPIFISEVTTPSIGTGWLPRFVDAISRPRYLTAQQLAFVLDRFTAPTPAVVPELLSPLNLHRVEARRPLTPSPALFSPLQVPDVTQPVTSLSWLARYPDRLERRELPTYVKLSYTGVVFLVEFLPPVEIHEIEGRGSFNRKISGRGAVNDTLRGRGSL